jgi:hypothetical protein
MPASIQLRRPDQGKVAVLGLAAFLSLSRIPMGVSSSQRESLVDRLRVRPTQAGEIFGSVDVRQGRGRQWHYDWTVGGVEVTDTAPALV